MFRKLLVALDGGLESERVLPLAEAIAGGSGGELTLARVIPENTEFTELDEATRHLASIQATFVAKGIACQTSVLGGDVVEQLLREIDRVEADVVLLSTHGRGGLTRAIFGSTTEQILKRSSVPVLALRGDGKAPKDIRTILVPMDNSLGSAAALSAAQSLARPTSARIELLHAVLPLTRYFRGRYIEPEWEEEARSRAQADMELLASSLRHRGWHAHGRAVLGQAAASIADVANQVAADVIVMSTRNPTGLARAILGSVADEVLRTAPVPVLLLHFNLEQGLAALKESAAQINDEAVAPLVSHPQERGSGAPDTGILPSAARTTIQE